MLESFFLLFFLFAVGAPLVLYFLVENEGRERVTDRASAETWARRDRRDRPADDGAGDRHDGGRSEDSNGWGNAARNRDDDGDDDRPGWNR